MKRYTLERVYLQTETLGSIYDPEGTMVCKTMELPWKDNRRGISCIPEGVYIVKKMEADKFRKYAYFRFVKVDGRTINPELKMSTILIHRAAYVHHLKGCIGVGTKFIDLNKDTVPDMVDSREALNWMIEHMPDLFELEIKIKS